MEGNRETVSISWWHLSSSFHPSLLLPLLSPSSLQLLIFLVSHFWLNFIALFQSSPINFFKSVFLIFLIFYPFIINLKQHSVAFLSFLLIFPFINSNLPHLVRQSNNYLSIYASSYTLTQVLLKFDAKQIKDKTILGVFQQVRKWIFSFPLKEPILNQ